MCLGIPGQIIEITDSNAMLGIVIVSGIKREVNLACVIDSTTEALIGKWALIHVGFAMCIIDEKQAKETLSALEAMQDLDHEIDDFSQRQQIRG